MIDPRHLPVVASVLLAAAVTTADAQSRATTSGRCPDGRVWTYQPEDVTRMFAALNAARSAAGREPLRRHEVLDRMAHTTSVDMACRDYFGHQAPGARTLKDKLEYVAGRDAPAWDRLAEIIGTSDRPERQVERWLGSRSHRRALLNDDHERVGIGLVRIKGSRYATYWTVEFMRERDDRSR
jgi:uncharacterized protein YkwD